MREDTNVTFRFEGTAEQVFLCLRPCDDAAEDDACAAWQTLALPERAPGVWTSSLRLPAGWWRFRYYTQERGCLFYAQPTQSVLQMNGLDGMLHVSRTGASKRGGAIRLGWQAESADADQYLCALPEVDDAYPSKSEDVEAAGFSPSPGGGRAGSRVSETARDAGRHDRHGRRRAPGPRDEETVFEGTQAAALWRWCRVGAV